AGGTMLASGGAVGTQGQWVDVGWSSVPITPGITYYLRFVGNTTLGIAGDVSDPYPNGQVYANPGFGSFPSFDYTFKTFTCPAGCAASDDVSINVPLTIEATASP